MKSSASHQSYFLTSTRIRCQIIILLVSKSHISQTLLRLIIDRIFARRLQMCDRNHNYDVISLADWTVAKQHSLLLEKLTRLLFCNWLLAQKCYSLHRDDNWSIEIRSESNSQSLHAWPAIRDVSKAHCFTKRHKLCYLLISDQLSLAKAHPPNWIWSLFESEFENRNIQGISNNRIEYYSAN